MIILQKFIIGLRRLYYKGYSPTFDYMRFINHGRFIILTFPFMLSFTLTIFRTLRILQLFLYMLPLFKLSDLLN